MACQAVVQKEGTAVTNWPAATRDPDSEAREAIRAEDGEFVNVSD
jgi:hypothetical protein